MGNQMFHTDICGELMADISTSPDAQQFKYGGKVLAANRTIDNRSARRRALAREDRSFGLDLYDFHARQQDAKLGRFNSIDPLAEKYYGISPYAYCLGNPINYVDSDGKKPRICIETSSLTGHTFVTVGEGQNTIVYTYGRYGALGCSGSVLHSLTPTGEGILRKLSGCDAMNYIREEIDKGVSIYTINNAEDEDVTAYFNQQWDSGTKSKSEKLNFENSRVVDSYDLISNNCTTKSISAVNAGSNDTGVPSKQTRVGGTTVGTSFSYSVPIFKPSDLKAKLDEISKTRPQDIIKIEDPQKFYMNLINQGK